MTKLNFILSLHDKLSGLPLDETEERLNFYSEMIDDRMEEGLSEEEAVAAVGSVDEIAAQIIADIPFPKIAMEKLKPKRRLKVWEIVFLILGAPVWLPLLISAIAVVLSVYVSWWAVLISLWAGFVSLVVCAFAGVIVGAGFAFEGFTLSGLFLIGAALICTGLSVFWFFGCKYLTIGTGQLTKKAVLRLKKQLTKKEVA